MTLHAEPPFEPPTASEATKLFARIFVPVDFTLSSQRAVAAALELKKTFGSAVCLFHVAAPDGTEEFIGGLGNPASPTKLVEEAMGRLRRFVENIAPDYAGIVEVAARPDVRPLEDMRDEARRWGATLLVASADAHGLFRSPAEKLVRGFELPVLLIPPLRQ